MVTVRSASLVLPVLPDAVFELLADPAAHARFDATAMVGAPVVGGRLTRVGQVFTMAMSWVDGEQLEVYRTDNHVVVSDPPRRIGWATAVEGGAPLGWTWTYALEPVEAGTRVTLTYDWTATPPEHVARFGVPLVDETDLAESLRLLGLALRAR